MSKESVGSEPGRRGKEPWQSAPSQPNPPQSAPAPAPVPAHPPILNGRPPFHRPQHQPSMPHQPHLAFNHNGQFFSPPVSVPMPAYGGIGPMGSTPSITANSLSGHLNFYHGYQGAPGMSFPMPAYHAPNPAAYQQPYAMRQPPTFPGGAQHFAGQLGAAAAAQGHHAFQTASGQAPPAQAPLQQINGPASAAPNGPMANTGPPHGHYVAGAPSRTPPPHAQASLPGGSSHSHSHPPAPPSNPLNTSSSSAAHHTGTIGRKKNVLAITDPTTNAIVNEDAVKAAEKENEENEAQMTQTTPSPAPSDAAQPPQSQAQASQPQSEAGSSQPAASPAPPQQPHHHQQQQQQQQQPEISAPRQPPVFTPALPANAATPPPGALGARGGICGSVAGGASLPPLIPQQNGHQPPAGHGAGYTRPHQPPTLPCDVVTPDGAGLPALHKEASGDVVGAQFATQVAQAVADSPSAKISAPSGNLDMSLGSNPDNSAAAAGITFGFSSTGDASTSDPSNLSLQSPEKDAETAPLTPPPLHNGSSPTAAAAASTETSPAAPTASLSEPEVGGVSPQASSPQPSPSQASQAEPSPVSAPKPTPPAASKQQQPEPSIQVQPPKEEPKSEAETVTESAEEAKDEESGTETSESLEKFQDWASRLHEYRSTIGARTYHPGPPPSGDRKYGRDILVIISEYAKHAELKPNDSALAQKDKCQQVRELYDLSKPGPSAGGGGRQSGSFAPSWQKGRHGPLDPPRIQSPINRGYHGRPSGGRGGGGGGGGGRAPAQIVIQRPSQKNIELENRAENAYKIVDSTKVASELAKKMASVEDEAEKEKMAAEFSALAIKSLKKKVRGILNKITPTNFEELLGDFMNLQTSDDKGTDQPCAWSVEETDAIVEVIFDKAVEEPLQCQTYAELCQMTVNKQLQLGGKRHVSVFRNVLLKTCQNFFLAAESAERPSDLLEKKLAEETDEKEKKKLQKELDLQRIKEKRRITGNIRFIGELFKMNLLVPNIIHHCVILLLKQVDEESIECLCKLLETVGEKLETGKAEFSEQHKQFHSQIPNYYAKLKEYADGRTMEGDPPMKFSSRIRFMILDLLDYRKSSWKVKKGKKETGPKKIEEVRVDFKAEQLQKQLDGDRFAADQRRAGPPGRFSQGAGAGRGSGGRVPGAVPSRSSLGHPGAQPVRTVSNDAKRMQAAAAASSAGGRTELRNPGALKKSMEAPADSVRLGPGMGAGAWSSRGNKQVLRSGAGSLGGGSSKASSPSMSRESSMTRVDREARLDAIRATTEIAGGGGRSAVTASMSASASTPVISAMEGAVSPPPTPATDAFLDDEGRAKLFGHAKSTLQTAESAGFDGFFDYLEENVKKYADGSHVIYMAGCLKEGTSSKESMRRLSSALLRRWQTEAKDVKEAIPEAMRLLIGFFVDEDMADDMPKLWQFLGEILADALSPKKGALSLRLSDFAEAFLRADYKAADLLAFTLLRIQGQEGGDAEFKRIWRGEKLMAVLKKEQAQSDLLDVLRKMEFPDAHLNRIDGMAEDSEPETSEAESSGSSSSDSEDEEDPLLAELEAFVAKGKTPPSADEIRDHISETAAKLDGLVGALFTALMDRFATVGADGKGSVDEAFEEYCNVLGPVYIGADPVKQTELLKALAEFCRVKGWAKGLVESLSDALLLESQIISSEAFSQWMKDPATNSMITKNGHLKSKLLHSSSPSQDKA